MQESKVIVEEAVFGMGCFWGVQSVFDAVPGVIKTEAGYMGGDETVYSKPSYAQVCSDVTGYAEVVRIEYDKTKVSYGKLLDIFWKNHNSTTKNQQGADYGSQYRSAIFYYSEEQREKAEKSLEVEQKKIKGKIVTEIANAEKFFKAEEYHQDYYKKKGIAPSCHI